MEFIQKSNEASHNKLTRVLCFKLILIPSLFQVNAQNAPRLLINHFGGAGGASAYNLRINQSSLFHDVIDTYYNSYILKINVDEQNPTPINVASSSNDGFLGNYEVNNNYIFQSFIGSNEIIKKDRITGNISNVCLSCEAKWIRQHGDYIYYVNENEDIYRTNFIDSDLNDKELVVNIASSGIKLLTFYGDELFFLDNANKKISKINASNNIVDIVSFTNNGTFTIDGDFLYYIDINDDYSESSLLKFDLINYDTPIVLSSDFWSSSIVAKDDYLYYMVGAGTGISIYEISLESLTLSIETHNNISDVQIEYTTTNYIKLINLKTSKDYLIYDLSGREVLSGIVFPDGKIDISKISSGLWVLKLDNSSAFKFIKK